MIKETFLHFIWKLQYFYKQNLETTQGEKIQILHPGILNTDSGPDFYNARIKIGNIEWYGNIEIHINSSDWKQHNHHNDEAYNNVILHVVWNDDEPVRRDNDSLVPAIELKNRISEKLILKYSSIIHNKEAVPCVAHYNSISELRKVSMIDRVVVERLENKSIFIKNLVQRNKGDWQESGYQLLARNFGFKLNADPFSRLAYSIPLKSLLWHRVNLFQIEAMLFGQSGLLEGNFFDEYPKNLKKEYEYLSKKFSFNLDQLKRSEWKFLRIRPANFPTIRIAEFSSLINSSPDFFSLLTDFNSVKEIHKLFNNAPVSEYWNEHYIFDKKADNKLRMKLGEESINNIIINTVVPYLFCLGKEKDNEDFVEKALALLEETEAENNKVIRLWNETGQSVESAYESQGYIELYNNYCTKKMCLNCEIGVGILKEQEFVNDF